MEISALQSSFSKLLNKRDLNFSLNLFFDIFLKSSGILFHRRTPTRDKEFFCMFVCEKLCV